LILSSFPFLLSPFRLHRRLASAQADGEQGLRALVERSERDIEDRISQHERTLALSDLRRQADVEGYEARQNDSAERADAEAEERHARKQSVQLAINLAEEERFRRVAEAERERLAALSEEGTERAANQRAVSAAVEEERKRRVMNNPLGSPFARPGHAEPLSEEALEEENRRASALLADAAATAERRARMAEAAAADRVSSLEESTERKLNKTQAVLLTEAERSRRLQEDEDAHLEEERVRRHNVAAASVLEAREQAERVSRAQHDATEGADADERERVANRIKAVELVEAERQAQIVDTPNREAAAAAKTAAAAAAVKAGKA
jgi:hypothetical protein